MKKRSRHSPVSFPLMMAELMLSSWETIAWRSLMIAQGSCSPAEYQRMVVEKMQAAQHSGLALSSQGDMIAALRPWHRRAKANAKRLRKK
jgi:hypothetical protein